MHLQLLFGFDPYYPNGGMNDFLGEFSSTEELLDFLENELKIKYTYLHVFDTTISKVHKYELRQGKYKHIIDIDVIEVNERENEARIE
ncbi:hypothetical protein ANABIO32_02200 [Rossellomorea marisflavi]|uniref:hypothetical protein n=1 Tax=Rossellomorea marisflavi TaxID=189381 RepID=UPI0025CB3FB8|nr:hypothetical protein [Rossellomorea marisflavi]GLI82533.1 hypothetical protein ANABIO32_02200 [Rossellomorea marisflavi]